MGGLAFDLEGVDAWDLTAPPAPALASAEEAGRGFKLYWMALLRDLNFLDYSADHPDVAAVVADLNAASKFMGSEDRRQGHDRDPLPRRAPRHPRRALHLAVPVAQHPLRRRARRAADADPAPAART